MSQPVMDRSPRRRVRWVCRCGFKLVAGPFRPGGSRPAVERFFAADPFSPVKPNERLARCPRCAQPWPAIAWPRFEDEHLAAAFAP